MENKFDISFFPCKTDWMDRYADTLYSIVTGNRFMDATQKLSGSTAKRNREK